VRRHNSGRLNKVTYRVIIDHLMFDVPRKRCFGHPPPEGNLFMSQRGAHVFTQYSSCTDVKTSGGPMPSYSTQTDSLMTGYGSIFCRTRSYSFPLMLDQEYASDNSSRTTKYPSSLSGCYRRSLALVLLLMRTLIHYPRRLGPPERLGGQSRGCGSKHTSFCMRITDHGSG